ncbi:MAG TPA: UDP-N-acetylglucosamine 2-epimerase, partial [Pyrinomonadaceae bacterium]|nr:UDP-N-acetylglucosamine 2-epimerase [Pyrinomonadaceae bacterium]
TPSEDGDANLLVEGVAPERIRFVGNVMIDSLFAQLERAKTSRVREQLGVEGKDYAVLTLHRPSNVDDHATLARLLDALEQIGERLPIVFPVHPRTRRNLVEFGFAERIEQHGRIILIEPQGYLDFLRLYSGARLVLTDSGGLQEETTALGIPCLTLRENTERPVTVELGTNRIVGTDTGKIMSAAFAVLDARRGDAKTPPRIPPLWDGRAADRILDALIAATPR